MRTQGVTMGVTMVTMLCGICSNLMIRQSYLRIIQLTMVTMLWSIRSNLKIIQLTMVTMLWSIRSNLKIAQLTMVTMLWSIRSNLKIAQLTMVTMVTILTTAYYGYYGIDIIFQCDLMMIPQFLEKIPCCIDVFLQFFS